MWQLKGLPCRLGIAARLSHPEVDVFVFTVLLGGTLVRHGFRRCGRGRAALCSSAGVLRNGCEVERKRGADSDHNNQNGPTHFSPPMASLGPHVN